MSVRSRFLIFCSAAFLFGGACPASKALTIDWDTVSWTNGSLINSLDVDPSRPGNDATVTVSGDTGQLEPELDSPNPQTPAVTRAFDGGLTPGQRTLSLAVDFANRSQVITVTVDFSAAQYAQGVSNVSFTIFDVDFSNTSGNTYQDQLTNIRAVGIDGSLIAPTITTSANNSLSGTGLNQVVTGTVSTTDTGTNSGRGNVTISFGSAAIRSFTFSYGSGSGTVANPTYQHIGLHDITFTPVPEMNPALGAVFSCIGATLLVLRHNARNRRPR